VINNIRNIKEQLKILDEDIYEPNLKRRKTDAKESINL
jgi:hypothetical protein